MDLYMLDPGVLALQRCYFPDLNVVYPQIHDNRARRYDAYRQYTLFVHCRLRRGDRIPVPSCVTHRIRVAYPSDTGLYTGFIPGTLL